MDTIGLDSEAKEEEQQYQNALEILSEIAGRSYEPGETVFSEGDPGMEIHFIISGAVKIYLGHDDKRRELMTLTAGDIFGEMALL
ncbi:MAG: cyclic nucleotide-binding domain-containing protein, partial [Candidatus Sericytochromatia bacterium]